MRALFLGGGPMDGGVLEVAEAIPCFHVYGPIEGRASLEASLLRDLFGPPEVHCYLRREDGLYHYRGQHGAPGGTEAATERR